MTLDKSQQKSSFIPMAIVAALFFILGFATWLNGSLMPLFKTNFATQSLPSFINPVFFLYRGDLYCTALGVAYP